MSLDRIRNGTKFFVSTRCAHSRFLAGVAPFAAGVCASVTAAAVGLTFSVRCFQATPDGLGIAAFRFSLRNSVTRPIAFANSTLVSETVVPVIDLFRDGKVRTGTRSCASNGVGYLCRIGVCVLRRCAGGKVDRAPGEARHVCWPPEIIGTRVSALRCFFRLAVQWLLCFCVGVFLGTSAPNPCLRSRLHVSRAAAQRNLSYCCVREDASVYSETSQCLRDVGARHAERKGGPVRKSAHKSVL
jgi:hypothetical protein